jgi:uncharacterized protein YgiB involved in biofilm formation
MKRSKQLALTSLMAIGGVSLTACGGDAADNLPVDNPGRSVDAFAYQSLQECKDKNEVEDAVCEKAEKDAQKDDQRAASWNDQASCEEVYGQGQCVPRQQASGSFWGPLITGFVVGRMLDGGWGGRGMYRDWRSGGFYSYGGDRIWRDYSTGRTRIGSGSFERPDIVRAPEKVMTRSSVISRGGFGGRMSNRSYSGSRWGG